MNKLLNSPEMEMLSIIIEEATRSTKEGVKRFIEPIQGSLSRASSKRHHIIFGRRGSGKSSLLRKAANDLTIDRRPIAYVDLEAFKGNTYPNVLLSVLIKSFTEFEEWLRTAAINPSNKTSFWQRTFGTQPKRSAFNRKEAAKLADELHKQIEQLTKQLYAADDIDTNKVVRNDQEAFGQNESGVQIGLDKLGFSSRFTNSDKVNNSEELQQSFHQSKTDFLHRHMMEYQNIFRQISILSGGDAYLFLDDLYHIRRSDQAKVIDYFHSIAKGNNLWLKIGTIRHRTRWYVHGDPPIGVKLGDDADDIDLDLTLEKYGLAKDFLLKILKGFMSSCGSTSVEQILTDDAIDRLVLASGGVTRDFLGLFRRSIVVARERGINDRGPKIGAEDVNKAAGEYDTTKQEELGRDTLNEEDKSMLDNEFYRIVSFCTDQVKTNIFLLDKNAKGEKVELIQELVDLRLLHKIRDRVTVKNDQPGKIFEAYMLDVSQYTGSRLRRNMTTIEFWRRDSDEKLRRASLIYNPDETKKVNNGTQKSTQNTQKESSVFEQVELDFL